MLHKVSYSHSYRQLLILLQITGHISSLITTAWTMLAITEPTVKSFLISTVINITTISQYTRNTPKTKYTAPQTDNSNNIVIPDGKNDM